MTHALFSLTVGSYALLTDPHHRLYSLSVLSVYDLPYRRIAKSQTYCRPQHSWVVYTRLYRYAKKGNAVPFIWHVYSGPVHTGAGFPIRNCKSSENWLFLCENVVQHSIIAYSRIIFTFYIIKLWA